MPPFFERSKYSVAKITELLTRYTQELQDLPTTIKRETTLQQQAALLAHLLVVQCHTLDSGFIVEVENLQFVFLNDSRTDDCHHVFQEYAVAKIIEAGDTKLILQQWDSLTIGPFVGETEIQAITSLYEHIIELFTSITEPSYFYKKQDNFEITLLETSEE